MQTTTIPLVKGQLITVLKARQFFIDNATKTQIDYAWPGQAQSREQIFLGRVTGSQEWAALRAGRKPRDEEYVIHLFIEVSKPEGNAQETETRAFLLLAEIENAIAEDPQLGLTAVDFIAAAIGEFELVSGPDPEDEGWNVRIRVEIECKARLT